VPRHVKRQSVVLAAQGFVEASLAGTRDGATERVAERRPGDGVSYPPPKNRVSEALKAIRLGSIPVQ